MSKKYLVIPGYVASKSDGDHHYIGARRLMELYKVDPRECVIATDEFLKFTSQSIILDFIHLEPRYDGNYKLPE